MSDLGEQIGPATYVAQQLATIHDKKVRKYLVAGDIDRLERRLTVIAMRRPSLLQRLLGIDNSVGATNALLVIGWRDIPATIEVYVVDSPPESP